MRYLVEIIINILLILLYVIVSTLENKTISTIFSIVLIILLIFSILRISVNLIKEKRKKKIIFILTNIFLIIVVLLWNYTINNLEEIINVFGSYYISNLETDNYNSEFNEINYKDVKILYKNNIEEAIPFLKEYIDNSKYDCERIFDEVNISLTIKLDYDKDVFLSRFGRNMDNLSAYYIDSLKTIYMYVDNSYDISNDKNNFSKILTHEISHYYFSQFLKENNILAKNVPVWINDGIADYISQRIQYFSYDNSEFIPFKKLSSANDWNNITSGKQYIQSFYSINKIISMSNETVIKNLLLELKNSDFNIAFEKVVGEEFPTFENNIKNEMQNVKNKKANIKSNGKI